VSQIHYQLFQIFESHYLQSTSAMCYKHRYQTEHDQVITAHNVRFVLNFVKIKHFVVLLGSFWQNLIDVF